MKLSGHLTLYADDTCLFYFGSNINDVTAQAQQDIDTLHKWFNHNLLTINASKTCYIIFKTKNKIIAPHDPLTVDNFPIEQKNCEKYLGLRIDNHLTFKYQIDYINKKLSSLIGSLINISKCIPKKIKYNIYNSLVKSHLLYLIEIWGNTGKSKLQALQRKQNKIIKILFGYPTLTPTTELYKDTNIMNLRQLYVYNACIFIKKNISKLIRSNLTFIKQNSKRSSRRASLLVLPKIRTKLAKKNINFDGAQLYNKLPASVKNVSSVNEFKSKLSKYILENTNFYSE